MKAVIPSRPLLGPVLAKTRPQLDWPTPEIQVLEPFKIYRSPFFSARVWIARPGSEPPLGSVMATKVFSPASTVGAAYFLIWSLRPRKMAFGGSQPKAWQAGI